MTIEGKHVFVLGGAGQVGAAVCRELAADRPAQIVVSSLLREESEGACEELRRELSGIRIEPAWGNVFVRSTLKDCPRGALLSDPELRAQLVDDILGDLTPELVHRQYLYQLLTRYRPQIVIDAVNTATAVAYQDMFSASRELKAALNGPQERLAAAAEQQLCTLYLPQLIRHMQILFAALADCGAEIYLKIGTSGTGGMGLNIPYTHSEEKPSPVLLSKSAIAGAHTMLLFLMGRTPGCPIVKEIKPTAVIAWKSIGYGPIHRRGEPIRLYDCPPEGAVRLGDRLELRAPRLAVSADEKVAGAPVLSSVYVDTGENGVFSAEEFIAITAPGQMEFVTPEEIAREVSFELKGGNSGHEIINALDYACLGPTYRAGTLRGRAIARLRELERAHGVDSVAFEILGPPRLAKLLYEAHLLRRCFGSLPALRAAAVADVVAALAAEISENAALRSRILSIGIAILMPDGTSLLRGPLLKIPTSRGLDALPVTPTSIDRWTADGWVDLRPANAARWKQRVERIFAEIEQVPHGASSSRYERDREYWLGSGEIEAGKIVSWIFMTEDQGERMKH
ncbi:MAG: short-chain dehydrogenase [Candidatus Schekmanbacteria bacterium]|nr:short-chain dehydrogenase [Candidatus Schekmanbacteria bacterium]